MMRLGRLVGTKGNQVLLPAAREMVDRAERIALTERDTAGVLELLETPPKPTPDLLAAARHRVART